MICYDSLNSFNTIGFARAKHIKLGITNAEILNIRDFQVTVIAGEKTHMVIIEDIKPAI